MAHRLAKLTPPRIQAPIHRERLFRRLDAESALVWINGAPGAGKTSLVVSWLESRGRTACWYQVDTGDRDLASTFYYLGLAAGADDEATPLPLFTSEYAGRRDDFSRRFFRDFFARLPDNGLLILDNFQEADATLEEIVALAVDEVPRGCTIVIVSRAPAGPALARAFTHGLAVRIDAGELALDTDEAHSLAARLPQASAQQVERAHEASSGWAAGFMLLLENLRRDDAVSEANVRGTPQSVFDYLAGALFREVPDGLQRDLAVTAYLPSFTLAEAAAVAGTEDVSRLVERLHRRGLFTDRREGDVAVFEYHALFRAFLLAQAQSLLTATERRAGMARAAELLEASSRWESVLPLLQVSEEWGRLERVLLRKADDWLAQGRYASLAAAIGSIPSARVEASGPLLRHLAATTLVSNQAHSRELSKQAFERGKVADDPHEQVLAASAVVETYLGNFSDYSSARTWIGELAAILYAERDRISSDAVRAEGLSALLMAAILADPTYPRIAECADAVGTLLLHADLPADLRLKIGIRLLTYCAAAREFAWVPRLGPTLLALAERAGVSALRQAWCWLRLAQCVCLDGDREQAISLLERAGRLAAEHGFATIHSMALMWQIGVRSFRGELSAAEGLLAEMAEKTDPARLFDSGNLALATFFVERASALEGRQGLDSAYRALELGDRTDALWVQLSYRIVTAMAFADGGFLDEADTIATEASTMAVGTAYVRYKVDSDLVRAFVYLSRGDSTGAIALLRDTMRCSVGTYTYAMGAGARRLLTAVFAEALRSNIETAWIVHLVRYYDLDPPDPCPTQWPWSVRIRALGGFELILDGEPAMRRGRTPRKVIELLKLLVVTGSERFPQTRAADLLWPEADGDQALRNLKVSIHRLRKLLGRDDAVVVAAGAVGLNPRVVSVDAWEFARVRPGATGVAPSGDKHRFCPSSDPRSGLLLPDDDFPWVLAARERLNALERGQGRT